MITADPDLCGTGESYGHATTINMLSDDVLGETFNSSRMNESDFDTRKWKWDRQVRICRRGRQIIFASQCHLNPQLFCTGGTPVTEKLAYWPAFLITLEYGHYRVITPNDEDNIVAALEHRDRVNHVELYNITDFMLQSGKVATAMQEPFPALTHLSFRRYIRMDLTVSFLVDFWVDLPRVYRKSS